VGIAAKLSQFLCEAHPLDAARTLEEMPLESAVEILEPVTEAVGAAVISAMEPGRGAACLVQCNDTRAAGFLSTMPVDAAVRLLHRLDASNRERLIERMTADAAAALRRKMDYSEGTAGALMDTGVVAFPDDTECGEALRRVRRFRQQVRYYVYVTDQTHRLTGVLTLRELMHAPSSRPLASLVGGPVVCLHVRDSLSVVLRHAGWRSYHALPVVDPSGLLVGVVRYETLRRIEAETTLEGEPSMLVVGTTLGQAWLTLTTTLLDGLAGSLRASRSRAKGEGAEANHGQ
jgi:magnesium transporter